MKKLFQPVLVIVAFALAATMAWAPAASAAAKPTAPASQVAPLGVGIGTTLIPSFAWVHFLPTVESDHLVINRGDDIVTECWVLGEGPQFWDLVLDRTLDYAGYTPESYLTKLATQPCASAPIATTLFGTAWLHLYPQSNWEHQVGNLGDSIAAVCSVLHYDPSDGSTRYWDLIVDHANGLVGFTWDSSVFGATPPGC